MWFLGDGVSTTRDQQTTALGSSMAHHLFVYCLYSGAQLQQSCSISHGISLDVPFSPYFSSAPSTCLLSEWLHFIDSQDLCQLPASHWALLYWQFWDTKIWVLVWVSGTQKVILFLSSCPNWVFKTLWDKKGVFLSILEVENETKKVATSAFHYHVPLLTQVFFFCSISPPEPK